MNTTGARFDKAGATTWHISFPGEIQKGNGAPWHVGTEGHDRVCKELESILQNDEELSQYTHAKSTTVEPHVIILMTQDKNVDFLPIFSRTLHLVRQF